MAMKDVKLFYEKVQSDEVLQEKLKDLQELPQQERSNKLLTISEEEGFKFTEEEFKSYIQEVALQAQENSELDDDILDQVSGGAFWREWDLISIFTVMIGCAVSIANEKKAKGCFIDK